MADRTVSPPDVRVKATEDTPTPTVSAEEYMERYAHDFYEWVKGELIKMTPVSSAHNKILKYVMILLDTYFSLNPIGETRYAPFVMHIDATESRREPDLQIILNDNPGQLTDTAMVGPADICVEVVSPESVVGDHGEKLAEYEKGGVREYWIIDPLRRVVLFYRLEGEVYTLHYPDEEGHYRTPALPGLRLHVPTLWEDKLPGISVIVEAVKDMLGK